MRKFLIFSIIPLILVFGCSFDSTRIDNDMIEDARELQAMLPAIEAALTMGETEDESARTIANGTYTSTGAFSYADPDDLYTALSGTGGEERYPAASTEYMEDFYSANSGNRAYVTLSPATWPGPSRYLVNLYIYPLFSTTVNYINESYFVANTAWTPIDSGGTEDYTAFVSNTVHYFDGLVEEKTVNTTSFGTGLYYSPITVPDDPSDTAYDYPASITAPATTGTGNYSADVSSVFTGADNSSTVSVREFYTENPTAADISAISYVSEDITGDSGSTTAKRTVRRYSVSGSTKTVRAKTAADVTYSGSTWTTTTLEKVDIGVDTSGLSTYSSVYTISKSNEENITTITMSLVETGAGTNTLTGEMVYDYGRINITYDVTLDSLSGLVLKRRGVTIGTFPVNERAAGRLIQILLKNGNEFSGTRIGNVVKGLISNRRTSADVNVDFTFLEIITGSGAAVF